MYTEIFNKLLNSSISNTAVCCTNSWEVKKKSQNFFIKSSIEKSKPPKKIEL